VPANAGIPVTLVNEGFEGTFPGTGWSATGHWGKSACQKKTGLYSAWAEGSGGLACSSTYHQNEISTLVYGPFDLSDAISASLQFDLWLWSAQGDTFSWQASADGVNFFGVSLTESFTPNWTAKTMDLSTVPGLGSLLGDDSVWIGFKWQTDGFAVAFDGAYVDNVKVTKSAAPKSQVFLPYLFKPCPPPGSLFSSYLLLGDTGSAYVPDNPSLDLGLGPDDDFTVEGLFYVADLENTTIDSLFSKQYSYSLYVIYYNNQPDRFIYKIWVQPITDYVYIYYETDLDIGWHHVAITFDNEYTSNWDLMAIYVDGVLARNSVSTEWTPGINNSNQPTILGGSYIGQLEEMRISNTVRYSGLTYTVPVIPFTSDGYTRALYHFDETSGSIVFNDDSIYGNTLTGQGGAVTAVCGGS